MKKQFILIAIFIYTIQFSFAQQKMDTGFIGCMYDNPVSTLGIGLIIAPDTMPFEIYNDSLLAQKFATLNMDADDFNNMSLCSKFFKPDYGIMHFICLSNSQKAYKVLVNYSDVKYMPNTYEFKTWEDYILQSDGVGLQEGYYQPLRKEPNSTGDTIELTPSEREVMCPQEIKGDLLKVQYDCNPHQGADSLEAGCHMYIEQCKNPLTGWLKWKQENKLLIGIFRIE